MDGISHRTTTLIRGDGMRTLQSQSLAVIRRLLEPLPMACGTHRLDGRITWVNPFTAKLFNSTQRELVGAQLIELWPAAELKCSARARVRLEYGVVSGQDIWLRTTRLLIEGEVVAVGENVTDTVRFMACERTIERLRIAPASIVTRLDTPVRR